ncbi:MAG: FAD:protein FMN transferase [Burkholderiaceae bacterium]|nr:FAD:protein FMN transferase [Burkholderiaceae bacterium]
MRRRLFLSASLLAGGSAAGMWALLRPGVPSTVRQAERAQDGRFVLRAAALAFDTSVSVCAVHDDPILGRRALQRALGRIAELDRQLVVQRAGSRVEELNSTGRLQRPGAHLLRLVEFAQQIADASGGAFDPTVQPLWELYSACERQRRTPTRDELSAARRRIDWRAIEAGPHHIRLAPGTSITLNGIVQGYAADVAFDSLAQDGVADALIDAGEYGALGSNRFGKPWRVGIQHPRDRSALIGVVPMDGRFLATSGDYSTSFTDDFTLNHIFDPHTGVSPPRLSGVSVAARSGLLADALTKPMMVLDLAAAQRLLDRYPGAGAVWIDKSARIVATRNLTVEAV